MKKKVKKIPKYAYGNPGVNADYLNKISGGIPTNSTQGVTFKGVNITNNWAGGSNPAGGGVSKKGTTTDGATSSGGGTPWGAIGAAATQVGKGMMHSFGVEDNSQLGVTLNNSMEWAELGGSIVPGWGHLIGGVAGAAFGAFQKGGVDPNTGEIKYGGIFGRSKDSLLAESDMIKDNIRATQMTEQKKAEYAMNPNNPNGGSVMAAEGGIMRKPVDALISKGELIYNPVTKKLSQVPGSKGKPNKADDVYARLYEGDVVISNSPTMLMSNGKTPAQNLMGMVDRYSTGGTVKAREAIIKKVVNWQEANKTKPQEYAKFDEGDPGFFSYLMSNRTRPIDVVIYEYMKRYGKTAKEFKGFDGSDKSFLQGLQNIINANDEYVLPIRFTGGKSFDQVRSMPISSAVEFNPEYWNYYNQLSTSGNVAKVNVDKPLKPLWQPTKDNKTTHPEINNVWSRHKTSDFVAAETSVTTVPTVSKKKQETVASKKDTVNKPSSDKKTTVSRVTTSTAPSPEDTVLRRPERVYDYEEPAKAVTTPVDDKKVYGRDGSVRYDYTTPERKVTPADLGRTTNNNNNSYTGSNWRDNLYRMAVLSQPLWDRAEAEPVNYESPVYKYMPTQIDVLSQLRDADQSYALARYNFANLYPNTGAGMAAGLQAASNRAKQLADIRQWQTNAQNELIGKNVGIYNNWANEHARIMNDVYNKTAANRAAARNINRQNRAAALSNYGQMLSDDKKMAMERMKFNILKPAIKSTYEDATANDLINMYNSLFG